VSSICRHVVRFLSIVTVSAGLALLFLVPLALVRVVPQGERGQEKGAGFKGLAEDLASGPVRMLLAVNVVFYSAYTSLFFFFKDFGTVRGMRNPGFFFTVAMAVMIIVRLAGSRYFDRMKKARASAASMGILAVCHVALGFSEGPGAFLFFAAVFGVLWGVGIPLLMALIFDISEARFRGLNMNLSLVMMQAGFFLGPLVGGLILARWGYVPLFIFCGARERSRGGHAGPAAGFPHRFPLTPSGPLM
jgi:Arabinose efflux permease